MEETITNPINNIFAEIVYNVKGSNVDTTIVNGKVLMENRKINNVNKKEIIQKCEKIIERIKNVKWKNYLTFFANNYILVQVNFLRKKEKKGCIKIEYLYLWV